MLRLTAVLLFLATSTLVRADVDPGNWEFTMTTTVEGMPGNVGPVTQTRCLSAEDARDPSRVLGPGGGSACEFSNRNDTGTVFSFEISCSGQLPMRGSGTVRYSANTMNADVQLSASGAQNFVTRSNISARRLGPCS
jgi:uncharacterized protein DUF3617